MFSIFEKDILIHRFERVYQQQLNYLLSFAE